MTQPSFVDARISSAFSRSTTPAWMSGLRRAVPPVPNVAVAPSTTAVRSPLTDPLPVDAATVPTLLEPDLPALLWGTAPAPAPLDEWDALAQPAPSRDRRWGRRATGSHR